MYKINDTVLYGAEGVCKIVDITKMDLTGEEQLYYVLHPYNEHGSKIYVPVENKILTDRLSPVLSAAEIIDIVKNLPECEEIWSENTNQRKNRYHEIINSGDRKKLIQLTKMLSKKYADAKGSGARFSMTDDQYYKIARRVLYDEFSIGLNMTYDELIPFLNGEIELQSR